MRTKPAADLAVLACLVWILACSATTAAGVTVDIDKTTLNGVLGAIAVNEVEVQVSPGQTLIVELHDLKVTGLEPAGVNGEHDVILTSVTAVAPELGLRVPLEPRIALDVGQENGESVLELRFEELTVALPLIGRINLARVVPPMRYPTDNVFLLAGARGDVPITSRLAGVQVGRDTIRLDFDIEVDPKP